MAIVHLGTEREIIMSVPAWRRDTHENGSKKGYLDVTIAAEKLLFHTIAKISGNKGREYFSKSETFTKKIPLLEVARKIYHDLRKANLVYLETDYEKRHDLQLEALLSVEEMIALLTEFDNEKHIDGLEFWVGLIIAIDKPLRGWIKSDKERHYKILSADKQ